ncbi:glycosyltransferase family 2 protein [Thermoflexus sp.]|uniref:glycosyltransferase family 2 protein n=1 Tax=Thermoflexus sp. TaxID=1969742 RepID=UPI002ADDDD09|nr:glycosyltransferase family 2 protein [Thermoflexus sp.]
MGNGGLFPLSVFQALRSEGNRAGSSAACLHLRPLGLRSGISGMDQALSLVILTYNTRELALRCLAGLYEEALARGWQVIVVDNGSTDGTAEAIAGRFPGAELIRSERNRGFAAGMNLGLRRARGEVIVLMNADVEASADTLAAAAEALQARPDVGALSPLLRMPDGRPQPFAFGGDPSPIYLLRRGLRALLGRGPLHRWEVEEPIEVDWVSGACMLVRREVIERVGLLDEGFFLYFEDNDWCRRMRRAGWRIVYDPRFQVVHWGGASQPQRDLAIRWYDQSLIRFTAKHYGWGWAGVLWLLLQGYRWLMRIGRAQRARGRDAGVA